ncbi:DNA polymerase III subunit gamma/tau [Flavobacteriaceae bacterium 14752]|uniref:DNA polymerase III subunit gamma/tau n=1 Tax=Mesohalobacter salilacus TaxID=2491711 RepID=UPI000F63F8CC|nr:DNA polymerase III subunit gamma/tau [Flavobacteriaceae bacterium 14752]
MNHFVVSARKYRPETFDEVVGQKAVTSTLKNAIDNNHLAQALLFTGPRGVGKTSCARILAKTINQSEVEKNSDFAFNIFELDAASNNSVDDIRNLNDQVRIPPQAGKFKVYIIDEVHMLSQSAFNAFLKTLEEPPKHAIFILATTEKHKIIPTILSRCQVFDFKRITVQDIKEHLKTIATKEGVEAEDGALQIIAQKSDGAMRDALSTYDRVVSYCGTHLTRPAVAENLNVLDFETFLKTTDLLLEADIPGVLMYFNSVLSKGYDGQHFISGLASHFRDLLICKNPSTIELLEVDESTQTAYKNQAKAISMKQLLNCVDLANRCDFNYKLSQNKRLHVELCLMKLASIEDANLQKKKSHSINPPQSQENKQPESSIPKTETPTADQENNTKIEGVSEYADSENSKEALNPSESDQGLKPKPTKKNGLSLKAIKYKKEHENKTNANDTPEEVLSKDYTLEDIKSTWINFAEIIDKKGEKLLASTLLSDIPKLNKNCIEIQMPNETMKIEIVQNKGRILKYIQNSLQNTQIDLKVHVNAAQEKKYVHTKEEKYLRLKEINPKIELLKQKLDLDF